MKAVIIGAGNVATHLSLALKGKIGICQVFSRNSDNAKALALQLSENCGYTSNPTELCEADIYIISLKDDAIRGFLKKVPCNLKEKIWVHTSGSVGIDVFDGFNSRHGIIYPLQTFSKNVPLEMDEVPLFIEGSDQATTNALMEFAHNISGNAYIADSEVRRRLHIAAVFSCNFVNYMYSISEEILRESQLPFSVLIPLINETTRKISVVSPKDAQTGPAARGDKQVIDKHLSELSDPTQKEIYKLLSEAIFRKYNKQG